MSHVTLEEIAGLCAREYGVTLEQFRTPPFRYSPNRAPEIEARKVYLWLAKRHTNQPLKQILSTAGLANIQYARKCARDIEERVQIDDELAARVERIETGIDLIHEAYVDRLLAEMRQAA